MVNPFLFAAFSVVWALFFFYIFILSRRQARLQKELDALERRVQEQSKPGDSPQS